MSWGSTHGGEPLLFPGLTLDNKVKSSQFAAPLVGETFENLSLFMAGGNYEKTGQPISGEVNPDLKHKKRWHYVESKASRRRDRFKVSSIQLEGYFNTVFDYAKLGRDCQINYYLWTYDAQDLIKQGDTIGGIIELALGSVISLDIIHWSVLYAALKTLPEYCTHKTYTSWRASGSTNFEVLQISQPFLRRLRAAPIHMLLDSLHLDPDDYEISKRCNRVGRAKVLMDGKEFKAAPFSVFSITRPPAYVEFPDIRASDEVPF